jgi:hypothetical protein
MQAHTDVPTRPAMESYIVRIYRRPDAVVAVAAAGAAAGQLPLSLPLPPQTAALAGTVQALGGGETQTFDSAQALLKGLGLGGD